jgi:hypothetical protein
MAAESGDEAFPWVGSIRRTNSTLAMTRGFADYDAKDEERHKENRLGYHVMSGRPDVAATPMDDAGWTMRGTVQCCDGGTSSTA